MMGPLSSSTLIILVFRIHPSEVDDQTIVAFQDGNSVIYQIKYVPADKSLQFISGGASAKTGQNTIEPGFHNYSDMLLLTLWD